MNLPAIPPEPEPGSIEKRYRGELSCRPPSAPLHRPTELRWGGGDAWSRDESWQRLGETVRAKLLEGAGTLYEWWAWKDSSAGGDRPGAVAFGERGLVIAEPRLNSDHRRVYSISSYEFDPQSLLKLNIDHRPPASLRRTGADTTSSSSGPPKGPDIGLSEGAKGMLGHLPAKAQNLLQTPFLTGQRLLRYDWYRWGSEKHFTFFMYLAGPQDVTAAIGTRVLPVKHTDDNAHWSLTCRRASVKNRKGT